MWKVIILNYDYDFWGYGYREYNQIFNQYIDAFLNHGLISGLLFLTLSLLLIFKSLTLLSQGIKKLEACFTLFCLIVFFTHVFYLTKLFDFFTFLFVLNSMFMFSKKKVLGNGLNL